MDVINPSELYTTLSRPQLPFAQIVAIVAITLPAAAVLGYLLGWIRHQWQPVDRDNLEQIPGRTSLAAMLALLGLLLAFAFSASLSRYENRQVNLVEEAAAISTAFLTADLLEEPGRTVLQEKLLAYAQSRLATVDDIQDLDAWNAFLRRTFDAQAAVWPVFLSATEGDTSDPVRVALARALTDVLDSHTRRVAAAAQRIPMPVKLLMLAAAAMVLMVLGDQAALHGRPLTWRTFVFAALLGVVLFMILDLERSLEGLVKVNTDTMTATIYEMETALGARTGN